LQKVVKKHIYSILALLILSFALIQFSRDNISNAVLIDGDGSGHYAWLPTIFIHHSIDFSQTFENEKIRKGPDYQGHNYHRVNGILINKFTPGAALLMAPFFLLAFLISVILQMPTDGYNVIFQYSVGLAAVFWAWIGLVFLYRLLLTYKISPKPALVVTIASLFGTNLLAYTYLMPAFSHVYSFAVISILLFYVRSYFLGQDKRSLILASMMFGILLSIRTVNILIVPFLPFLGGSFHTLFSTIKSKLKVSNILYSALAFALAISPLIVINYFQTGRLIYFGYQNEGFYWSNPQILNFLFSFRKGWFVYTPLMLLIFPAALHIFKKNKFEFWWFIAFLSVLVYIFSSWWNWFFGDSFGMRPMVDFTAAFALVIALWVSTIKGYIKSITLIFILLASMLNLVQTYQYAKGIIHPDSMTKDAYFYVFLKTDSKYSGSISGGPEYYYGTLDTKPFLTSLNDFEKNYNGWKSLGQTETQIAHYGKLAAELSKDKVYSPSFKWKIPDSLQGRNNLYVKLEAEVFEPYANVARNAMFVMDIQNAEGKSIFYKTAKLKKMPDEINSQWRKFSTGFKLPAITREHYSLKIYIWNTDKQHFMIDDFRIRFFQYSNNNRSLSLPPKY